MSESAEKTPTKISDELRRQIHQEVREGLGRGRQGRRPKGLSEIVRSVSLLAIRAGVITIAIYLAIIAFTIYSSAGGQALPWFPGLSSAQTTKFSEQTNCSPICPPGYRLERVIMPSCNWNCVSWTSMLWPLRAGGAHESSWHGGIGDTSAS
ncbi:BQ2448_610 [Microbotryum intermedium]|uniref:BQ2448_610 protein n=1 Tax=Microbotryum intermedium TaxID=269621 RepID=A0A238F6W9_9BASI|nr:BQ2448_610 [Microbotryum intermedium]